MDTKDLDLGSGNFKIPTNEEQKREVDRNYKVFLEQLPEIIEEHRDEFALMSGGRIVSYHNTHQEALKKGRGSNMIYSIQEVTDEAKFIGWTSSDL